MNNALITLNNSLVMWDDSKKLDEIRKLFAPTLTEIEFQFFVGLGKASGLNPFTREIWCIKYDKNQPAQVFIGRDGYRKAAQAHPEYDFHQSDAVYEHDKFTVTNGEVQHSYTLTNRGKLVGAYCIAKRHKSSRPIYLFVAIEEYSTGRSVWKDKPATMIKKVAESQCLRACFQDLLGGTYCEEEYEEPINKRTKSEELKDKILNAKTEIVDAEIITTETGECATTDQLKEISALMSVKVFPRERFVNALAHFNVETLAELTIMQADEFINILNKLDDK
jgi:phage recombination protein Bet